MPFEAVAESLLKGGVAPRHVRRYVTELDEHLDELVMRQREAGDDAQTALRHARARLGQDHELSAAMLAQPGMRSWPARLPWLVFVALPPVVAVLGVMPLFLAAYFLGDGAWRLSALTPEQQEMVRAASRISIAGIDILFVPLVAGLFAFIARRQRLAIAWPLLGMAVLLLLFPHLSYQFGGQPGFPGRGNIGVHLGLIFLPDSWPTVVRHWPVLAAQGLIALAPMLWLLRGRSAARA